MSVPNEPIVPPPIPPRDTPPTDPDRAPGEEPSPDPAPDEPANPIVHASSHHCATWALLCDGVRLKTEPRP